MMDKEEYAIVLDYLPYGYPLEKKMIPLAQAIGAKNFVLLELIPRRGVKLEAGEKVYIGEGKRDKIYYILGRLRIDRLTETAKGAIEKYLKTQIEENEKKFVDFFNTADAINTRLHQFELIPGFGKKHTLAILEERKKKPFSSLEDLKKRISNLPDPKTAIIRRLAAEINEEDRYRLFAR